MTRPIGLTGLVILLAITVASCRNAGGDPAQDTTSPTVAITGPSASTSVSVGEAFELQGTADDNVAVTSVEVVVNDATPIDASLLTDGTWTAEVTPAAVGPLAVSATAIDAAGNRSDAAEIEYDAIAPLPDTAAPTVAITGPSAITAVFVGETFELQGTADDNVAVTSVEVVVNDATPIDATLLTDGTWTAEVTPAAVGPLAVSATAIDAAGNRSAAAEIQYVSHHRGRSLRLNTFNIGVGAAAAGVRVFVTEDGVDSSNVPVTATVRLNGTDLPYLASGNNFQGPLPAGLLVAGGTAELSITDGDTMVSVEWKLPEALTQDGPPDGTNFPVGDTVTVSWMIDEDPDFFQVSLVPNVGFSSWSESIPGDQRSFELDVSDLPADGSPILWRVVAFNVADPDDYTGQATAGSRAVGESPSGQRAFSIGSP